MLNRNVSHFKNLEKLGEYGMCIIYKAEDIKLNRTVTLIFFSKKLTSNKEAIEKFRREALAVAALNNPNIVTIHEINEHEGHIYLAMEYIEGKTLKERIQSFKEQNDKSMGNSIAKISKKIPKEELARPHIKPMEIQDVVNIAIQICNGMKASHNLGIVHRDINPQNLIISKDGVVKIVDFGISKLRLGTDISSRPIILDNIHYMSPDQLRGKEIDYSTDIWSFGVLMYEMLTAKLPFRKDKVETIMYDIINENPDPPIELNEDIPEKMNRIILKCLGKTKKERYKNVESLLSDLNKVSNDLKNSRKSKLKNKTKLGKEQKFDVIMSGIDKWWAEYGEKPFAALGDLLFERAYMGKLNRSETDEILFRLFHKESDEKLHQLDGVMRQWCESYWGKIPDAVSASHWAKILQNAFIAVYRLHLSKTILFLRDAYMGDKSWLRGLYHDPSRDPEAALLRTLALSQTDQTLLPLWMRLCAWQEDLPIDYTSIGLLGLRKLPGKDGKAQGDLPEVVFKGIVSMAEAFAERKKPEYKNFWLREVRAVFALYPRSKQYWSQHFSPLLYNRTGSPPGQWLDKAIPKLSEKFRPGKDRDYLPPPKRELDHCFKLITSKPLKDIRDKLDSFLDKHRAYAYQTGDSDLLVRTLSNISSKLDIKDTSYALKLLEEAFDWAPYDPYLWSQRAIIETVLGNISQAETLLWQAKRRFPENPPIRNKLAELLAKQGSYGVAESLYRQTMESFPCNAVCRNGLAEVLKAQNRHPEAEEIYRQTMKDFPQNVVCRAGLTEVLKAQNKLAEAEEISKQAIRDFPHNNVCRAGLAEVLKAQGKITEAEEIYRQAVKDFPKDAVCKAGLAEVLKVQNKLKEAETVYRKAIEEFPQNVVCRNGLAVVLIKRGEKNQAISMLEDTVKNFPEDKVAREFLKKIKRRKNSAIDIRKLEKEIEKLDKKRRTVHSDFREMDDEESVKEFSATFTDLVRLSNIDKKPVPAAGEKIIKREEIAAIEKELGEVSLTHWQSLRAEGEKKEKQKNKTITDLQKILDRAPGSLPALLLKGNWLTAFEPAEAGKFLADQAESYHNILGFHLLQLRLKGITNKKVEQTEWDTLYQNFPSRYTLIRLERALYEMNNGNGTRLKEIEGLRKAVLRKSRDIPHSLQKNEEWIKESIKHGFFKNIDISKPISENSLPEVENHLQKSGSEMMLRDVVVETAISAV